MVEGEILGVATTLVPHSTEPEDVVAPATSSTRLDKVNAVFEGHDLHSNVTTASCPEPVTAVPEPLNPPTVMYPEPAVPFTDAHDDVAEPAAVDTYSRFDAL